MPKLFIFIPTYNRPAALCKQLDSIIPQIIGLEANVRLLISDNASTNSDVEHVLQGLPTIKNIVIHRNGGNIGGNANISLGFVFAKPDEFLWILSDNDIISPNAVSYLLTHLNPEIDFYCFNDEVVYPVIYDYSWNCGWQTPMKWRMGLISDALYNMSSIQAVIDHAFYFHNSSFPHLAVACAAAQSRNSVKFMLLPRTSISYEEESSHEEPTDYSLARVCMPLLVPLFPSWEAKQFCRRWLAMHGLQFHANKHKHLHLYIQTQSILRSYGGFATILILWITRLTSIVTTPYLNNRSAIVQLFKRRLSATCLERLRSASKLL